MAKSKPKSPFTGRWRIVSMSAWEQDSIDEEEEGYFEFGDKGNGEFHFGYVQGQIDYKPTTRDGNPPSSGPGTATTKWTRLRAAAGPS